MRRTLLNAVLAVGAALWALALHAAVDPYDFSSDAERQRYQQFIDDMRCPKCQNQNLAGSDAPIAADLRRELRRLLREGRTDGEIVDHMVARYGEYILYDPPLNTKTVFLWLAPAVFLAIGMVTLIVIVRRHRPAAGVDAAALSADEQKRVQQLLSEDAKDSAEGRHS
jgi:cytochrome c-type biogenesis protein CcmH